MDPSKKKLKKIQKTLSELQASDDYHPDKERDLMKELDCTLIMQEEYWRQRGRVDWITLNDKNTSYFHHKASARKERNKITSLLDSSGSTVSTQEGIKHLACSYFNNIYQSNMPSNLSLDGLHFNIITTGQRASLLCPFTNAELLKALKQIPGSKAPGPDGLHMIFI